MINVICCICKKKYGEKEDGKAHVRESHGYCDKCFKVEMKKIDKIKINKPQPGQPCNHPGCCSHISHPCEECGRTGCGLI